MKKGDVIEVFIEKQLYPNTGVAVIEGRRTKVEGALQGQMVNVKILKQNEKKMQVKNMGLVQRANYEKEPLCSFSDFCGGCTFPTLPYEMQLSMKAREVFDQLEKHKIAVSENLGIEGCLKRTAYRNKMEYTFGDEGKGGKPSLGMHRKGRYMDIVTVSDCAIAPQDFNVIVDAVLAYFQEAELPFYHKKEKVGLQRNLIIRRGENTKELLINLVTTSQMDLDTDKFIDTLLGLELENQIVGITHTINDGIADFAYCDRLDLLWGRDYYEEYILGLKFKVTPFSFFQTNTESAERLYSQVLDFIEDLEGKTVFDLYSGTGTIAQIMALKAEQVVGIELVPEAVEAARSNAESNGLTNCRFLCGDVFEMLNQVTEKPDLIVLDPPRAGIMPKALHKILDYGVQNIIYVSCNPTTMAENLLTMQENGYKVLKLKTFDQFPYTKHMECVALLENRKRKQGLLQITEE